MARGAQRSESCFTPKPDQTPEPNRHVHRVKPGQPIKHRTVRTAARRAQALPVQLKPQHQLECEKQNPQRDGQTQCPSEPGTASLCNRPIAKLEHRTADSKHQCVGQRKRNWQQRQIRWWPDQRTAANVAVGKKRSEEHTSELQSRQYLVCRLLLEKKKAELSRTPKFCGSCIESIASTIAGPLSPSRSRMNS